MPYGDRSEVATDDFTTDPFTSRWDNGPAGFFTLSYDAANDWIERGSSGNDESAVRDNGETFDDDQYSTITMGGNWANNDYAFATVRQLSSATDDRCYVGGPSAGNNAFEIWEIDNSFSWTRIANGGSAANTVDAGDTVTMEAEGTTIRVGTNASGTDTQELSTTDSTITTGEPGLYINDPGGQSISFSSWAGGDITAGTEFTQTVTGSITPSGALVRAAEKALAGSATPTGALVRDTLKLFSGSVSPAGALVKETQKPIAGAVTPSGALATIRLILRALAGSITPSGTIQKAVSKTLAGAVTPTGSMLRSVAKTLAGAIAPAGALVKETAKSFAGSVAPSGALTSIRAALQTVAGSVAPAGALAKQVLKSISGSVTPTATLTKMTDINFGGAVTPSGSVTRETRKDLAGTITPAGAMTPSAVFLTTVAGTIAAAGTATGQFISGGADTVIRNAKILFGKLKPGGWGN